MVVPSIAEVGVAEAGADGGGAVVRDVLGQGVVVAWAPAGSRSPGGSLEGALSAPVGCACMQDG